MPLIIVLLIIIGVIGGGFLYNYYKEELSTEGEKNKEKYKELEKHHIYIHDFILQHRNFFIFIFNKKVSYTTDELNNLLKTYLNTQNGNYIHKIFNDCMEGGIISFEPDPIDIHKGKWCIGKKLEAPEYYFYNFTLYCSDEYDNMKNKFLDLFSSLAYPLGVSTYVKEANKVNSRTFSLNYSGEKRNYKIKVSFGIALKDKIVDKHLNSNLKEKYSFFMFLEIPDNISNSELMRFLQLNFTNDEINSLFTDKGYLRIYTSILPINNDLYEQYLDIFNSLKNELYDNKYFKVLFN